LALSFLALLALFGRRTRPAAPTTSAPEIGRTGGRGELESRAVQDPDPIPLASLNSAENSALEPPSSPSAIASGAPATRKVPHPHGGAKPLLQKKGNERYGRFE